MKRIFLSLVLLAAWALPATYQPVHAQATNAVASSITCAASGSSTQVLAAAASRESYVLSNTSGVTIRLGFLTGSSTANLTDSNSILLLAGQTFADAAPSIYLGRMVCMSTTGATQTVYVVESRRP